MTSRLLDIMCWTASPLHTRKHFPVVCAGVSFKPVTDISVRLDIVQPLLMWEVDLYDDEFRGGCEFKCKSGAGYPLTEPKNEQDH